MSDIQPASDTPSEKKPLHKNPFAIIAIGTFALLSGVIIFSERAIQSLQALNDLEARIIQEQSGTITSQREIMAMRKTRSDEQKKLIDDQQEAFLESVRKNLALTARYDALFDTCYAVPACRKKWFEIVPSLPNSPSAQTLGASSAPSGENQSR